MTIISERPLGARMFREDESVHDAWERYLETVDYDVVPRPEFWEFSRDWHAERDSYALEMQWEALYPGRI